AVHPGRGRRGAGHLRRCPDHRPHRARPPRNTSGGSRLMALFGRIFGGKPDAGEKATPEPEEGGKNDVGAAAPVEAPAEAAGRPRLSWLQRLKSGLARSSSALSEGITTIFTRRKLDAAALEDLEDTLIRADLGTDTAERIVAALRATRYDKEISDEEVKAVLAAEITAALAPVARPLSIDPALKPHVVLVVGVNGTGKTTTIGKLAAKLAAEGRSVMLAAGDTFRAAAIEQLKIWGSRTEIGRAHV